MSGVIRVVRTGDDVAQILLGLALGAIAGVTTNLTIGSTNPVVTAIILPLQPVQ